MFGKLIFGVWTWRGPLSPLLALTVSSVILGAAPPAKTLLSDLVSCEVFLFHSRSCHMKARKSPLSDCHTLVMIPFGKWFLSARGPRLQVLWNSRSPLEAHTARGGQKIGFPNSCSSSQTWLFPLSEFCGTCVWGLWPKHFPFSAGEVLQTKGILDFSLFANLLFFLQPSFWGVSTGMRGCKYRWKSEDGLTIGESERVDTLGKSRSRT